MQEPRSKPQKKQRNLKPVVPSYLQAAVYCRPARHYFCLQDTQHKHMSRMRPPSLGCLFLLGIILKSLASQEIPPLTPKEKYEELVWYRFGPQHCHMPHVETAHTPPVVHPHAPWYILA
ncbi:hypothetical protein DSO57_1036887 [Entomophthora muscae]|uniref:Uncharacterized protein n=1 Tax=Entomophthora muscae TaxID=34485 RepID=A0ACC2SNG1_9FUNG|nr:hypothetical protein DSO57_1036887 [Entomophthora muscae]